MLKLRVMYKTRIGIRTCSQGVVVRVTKIPGLSLSRLLSCRWRFSLRRILNSTLPISPKPKIASPYSNPFLPYNNYIGPEKKAATRNTATGSRSAAACTSSRSANSSVATNYSSTRCPHLPRHICLLRVHLKAKTNIAVPEGT